ncbi:hypothetical protein N7512_008637 [Penicillium capsulatum]|nr:hypothetical protein N7512_008637 [Penicillium capsulatum]
MRKNTAGESGPGESAGRQRARTACPPCRAKKKRCTHQAGEEEMSLAHLALDDESEMGKEPTITVSDKDTQLAAAPAAPAAIVAGRRRRGRKSAAAKKAAAAPPSGALPPADASAPAPASPAAATTTSFASVPEGVAHPDDNVDGSIALSIHTVMARRLRAKMNEAQDKLQLAQERLQVAQEAMDETIAVANEVQGIVHQWAEAWKKGL